ncbi:MAG: hypothetical protein ACUVX1_09825 [Chloroflexota bacterium]
MRVPLSTNQLLLGASLLLLSSLALIVIGLQGPQLLWQVGLVLFGLAMLLSVVTQWTRH